MNPFSPLKEVPIDPILGIAAKFRTDTNPNKVSLSIGMYKSEEGQVALLESVHQAEKILYEQKNNKGYLPVDGNPGFKKAVLSLLVDESTHNYFYVCQCVGATSALWLSGAFLKELGYKNIYISDLTWPNHPNVYASSGIIPKTYEYYDTNAHALKTNSIIETLKNAPENSAVLFQMCCQNPTGRDFSESEWKNLISVVKEKKLFPVIDCAYQGFGHGLKEDVKPLTWMMEALDQLIVCYSCAKNFGVYGERVGAFVVFDKTKKFLDLIDQNARKLIRPVYSTPPLHGARIIQTILESSDLKSLWQSELKGMRERIKDLRQLFVSSMDKHGAGEPFHFVLQDKGLFSLLDFSKAQIVQLREKYSLYLLENGRINIAGLSKNNIDYVVNAFLSVTKKDV